MTQHHRFTHAAAASLAAILLVAMWAWAGPKSSDWNPSIDASRFVTVVDNEYFPLVPGRTLLYRSNDGVETLEFEVTNRTKLVMGITTTVVIERHRENGQIVEVSENWFAQDNDGNVWYFGEFSQSYENGVPSGTPGSWEAGIDGAKPGIIMRADPQVGDAYFQEFAPGIAQDQAQVKSTTEATTVLQGSHSGVLLIKEWSSIESNSHEKKYYAPGIGLLMEVKGNERLELIQIVP